MLNGILHIFLPTLPGYHGFDTTFIRSVAFLSFSTFGFNVEPSTSKYCLTRVESVRTFTLILEEFALRSMLLIIISLRYRLARRTSLLHSSTLSTIADTMS